MFSLSKLIYVSLNGWMLMFHIQLKCCICLNDVALFRRNKWGILQYFCCSLLAHDIMWTISCSVYTDSVFCSQYWPMHLFVVQPSLKKLAKEAFRSWVRAYTAHRGDLKRIFVVKKLHLGHVARSFGLKEQPSLVGKSFKMQAKKRKRDHKQGRLSEKRLVTSRT